MLSINLIHALPGLVFCLDQQGNFQLCNRQYELFIGKNQEKLKEKSIFEVLPQEIAEKLAIHVQKAISSKKKINYLKKIKNSSSAMFFQIKIIFLLKTKILF